MISLHHHVLESLFKDAFHSLQVIVIILQFHLELTDLVISLKQLLFLSLAFRNKVIICWGRGRSWYHNLRDWNLCSWLSNRFLLRWLLDINGLRLLTLIRFHSRLGIFREGTSSYCLCFLCYSIHEKWDLCLRSGRWKCLGLVLCHESRSCCSVTLWFSD